MMFAMWWLTGSVTDLSWPKSSPGSHSSISDGSQKEYGRELPANHFGSSSSVQFGVSLL